MTLTTNKTLKCKEVFFKSAFRWQDALYISTRFIVFVRISFLLVVHQLIISSVVREKTDSHTYLCLSNSLTYLNYHKPDFFLGNFFLDCAFKILITFSVQLYFITLKIKQYLWSASIPHLFNQKLCKWTHKIANCVSFLLSFPKELRVTS